MPLFRRRQQSAVLRPDPVVEPPARRLLVCDDNESVTLLLEMLFTREGWTVEVVRSGEDALDAVFLMAPDVLLLDQQMDGMTGVETATRLRDEGFDRPILLFSAHLDPPTRAAAEHLDVTPVSKVDFNAAVRHVETAYRLHLADARTARDRSVLP